MNEEHTQNKTSSTRGFYHRLKRYFYAGIATIFPLFVTGYLLYLLLRFSDFLVGKYINSYIEQVYGFSIPGLGLVAALILLLLIGVFATHVIGRRLITFFEYLLGKVPFIAKLYPSAKQLSDFLFNANKKEDFQRVVLVEYPYPDSYALGFITNEEVERFDNSTLKEHVSVFIPFAPAPFSGFIFMLPKNKVKPIDVSVDNAVKFIVSGGVVIPEAKK